MDLTREAWGEVSEWFKELVLKTSDSVRGRGFESHPLRQKRNEGIRSRKAGGTEIKGKQTDLKGSCGKLKSNMIQFNLEKYSRG